MKSVSRCKLTARLLPGIFSLVLLLPMQQIAAQTLEQDYFFPAPAVKTDKGYTSLHFPGSMNTGHAGEPSLPYQQAVLLLPPGYHVDGIEVIGYQPVEVHGKHVLYPYQPSRPLSDTSHMPLLIKQEVYRQSASYPATSAGLFFTQYLHGFPVLLTSFTPVKYHPISSKISYYQKITLRVHLKKQAGPTAALPFCPQQASRGVVASFVQNPGILDQYPQVTDTASHYSLLVVAPDIFSGSFQDLVDHYFVRGMQTKILTTSWIYAHYTGVDNAEKVRNCIIHEYQVHQIEHVLLAGDVELIPARGFYAQVQSSSLYTDNNIPADLYYSALDGNWNTDGDNLWGEPGEDDLLPELSVGRLPVSTVAELSNVINKGIHYQNHPIPAECRKPLLVGEHLWDNPLTWGGDYMDLLIGLQTANGYTTHGIPAWHNIQTLYDRDLPASWTPSVLLGRINEGASFLHHVGHANTTYLMRMYSSSIVTGNFQQINGQNHNYIPVYSHGCYCGAFDYSDCIAEAMVNLPTFAVSFIGNSRYGWFNEGSTEGPSEHIHREFVHALYGMQAGFAGTAHLLSKLRSAAWVNAPGQWEEGALRWCFYTCNLLGDPALRYWTEPPMDLTVVHADTLPIGSTSLVIQTDTSGIAVAGLYCIVIRDTALIGQAITDSLGLAQITFDSLVSGTTPLMVVVSGNHCLPDTSWVQVHEGGLISGLVRYGNLQETPLPGVTLILKKQDIIIQQTVSDSIGAYIFTDLPAGDYIIQASASLPWGGVNATDALLVMKHFVLLDPLSGIRLQAADIDQNQIVNAVDALYIQKRFVGMISSFPSPDYIFDTPILSLGIFEQASVYITGLCTGDVNASYQP